MDKTKVQAMVEIIDQKIDRLFEYLKVLSAEQENTQKKIDEYRVLSADLLEVLVGFE